MTAPALPMVVIERAYTPLGTFGTLTLPSGVVLYTVERPWLDNRPRVSCIPEGEYECRPRQFFRGGYPASEILDVQGRSHILFHVANRPRDVEGCIGVGSRLGAVAGDWAVLDSKTGFRQFMSEVGGGRFLLQIRTAGPASMKARPEHGG